MKLLFLLLAVLPVYSQVQVAFVEMRSAQGRVQQLELGGRFSHVAISYRGRWLQAHPYRGVELVDLAELRKMGKLQILSFPDTKEPCPEKVQELLGQPYDPHFSWWGPGTYCSKLVGQLLGISPKPMNFSAPLWPEKFRSHKGEPGLSPDDLFEELQNSLANQKFQCESLFDPQH